MKAIRSIILTTVLALGAFAAATYVSCSKDTCNGVVCQNGGICDDGRCVCMVGFEGNRCQTPSRDKMIGNYNGGDSCSKVGERGYSIRLLVSPTNKAQMVLRNILNIADDSAMCNMAGIDSFTFNGNYSAVSYIGTGKVRNDTMWLSYKVQFDTSAYTCKYFGLRL
jgi:hypothetical protein